MGSKDNNEIGKTKDKSFPKRSYFKKSAKHLGILAICIAVVSIGLGLAFLLIDILNDKGLDGWGILGIAAISAGVIVIFIGSFAIYASRHPYDNCLYRTTIGLFIVYCIIALTVIAVSIFAIIMLIQCEDHHFVFNGGKAVRLETNNCPQQTAGIIIAAILMFIWFLVPIMLSAVLLYRLFYALCPKKKSKKPFESVYLPKGNYNQFDKAETESSSSNIYVNTRENKLSRSSDSSLYSTARDSFKRSWNSFIKRSNTNSSLSDEMNKYKSPQGLPVTTTYVETNVKENKSYTQTKTYHAFTKTYTVTPNPIEINTNINSPAITHSQHTNQNTNEIGYVNKSYEHSENIQHNKTSGNWQLRPDTRRRSIDSEIQEYESQMGSPRTSNKGYKLSNIYNQQTYQVQQDVPDFSRPDKTREEVIRNLHEYNRDTQLFEEQRTKTERDALIKSLNAQRQAQYRNDIPYQRRNSPPISPTFREDNTRNFHSHHETNNQLLNFDNQSIGERPFSPTRREEIITKTTKTYNEDWKTAQQRQRQRFVSNSPPLTRRSNEAYSYQKSKSMEDLSNSPHIQRRPNDGQSYQWSSSREDMSNLSPPSSKDQNESYFYQKSSSREDLTKDFREEYKGRSVAQDLPLLSSKDSPGYKSGSLSNLVEEKSVRTITEVSGNPPHPQDSNIADHQNSGYTVKRVEEKVTLRKMVIENPEHA